MTNLLQSAFDYDTLKSAVTWVERPVPCNDFVMRDGELRLLSKLVKEKNVVSVIGGGGVGKTSLVDVFVSQLSNQNARVVWYTAPVYLSGKHLLFDFLCSVIGSQDKKVVRKILRNRFVTQANPNSQDFSAFLLDIFQQEELLVAIDDVKNVHAEVFRGLIYKLTRAAHCKSKLILISRKNILEARPDACLMVGGMEKDELFDLHQRFLATKLLTEDDLQFIWEKTEGNPLINCFLQNGLSRINSTSQKEKFLAELSQVEEIQDYFYRVFDGLKHKEKALLKYLVRRQGKVSRLEIQTFATLIVGRRSLKVINELVERSAIYESESGYHIPGIMQDYLSFFLHL